MVLRLAKPFYRGLVIGALTTLTALVLSGTALGTLDRKLVACPAADRVWLRDLAVLEAHIQVGVTYSEYGRYLTSANVDYKLASGVHDSMACLQSVTVPAERALNYYIRAYRSWSACIQKLMAGSVSSCTSGYGDSIRQGYWSAASSNLDRALRNLG